MRKRSLLILAVLFLAVFVSTVLAANYPNPTGYITDTTGTITDATKQTLIPALRTMHDRTSAQIGVAVIETTDGVPIEEYAVKLFEKWKVGTKGKDNGVLFVVALKDHKMRIEVGYGLEGAIPDAKAGAILDDMVKPMFKAGDINGGVIAGVNAIITEIAKEYKIRPNEIVVAKTTVTPPATLPTVDNKQYIPQNPIADFFKGAGFIMIAVFVIVLIVILAVVFGRRGGGGGYYYSSDNISGYDSGSSSSSGSDNSSDSGSDDSFDGGDSGGGGASSDW